MIPDRISPEQLRVAGAELQRQAETAQAAIRAALHAGGDTSTAREQLAKVARAIDENAALLAMLREGDAAARRGQITTAGADIARRSAEKLRLRIAELTPPRLPAMLRKKP